jgi:hypothetical protein
LLLEGGNLSFCYFQLYYKNAFVVMCNHVVVFLFFEFWNSIYDSTSCRVLEWFESLNRRDLYMMAHDILILVVLLLLLKFLLPMRNLILV